MWVKSPFTMPSQPRITTVMPMPMMNMSPPMVGVPCLVMCQVGPISLMLCPALSLISSGISSLPATAVMTKQITQDKMTGRIILFFPLSAPSGAFFVVLSQEGPHDLPLVHGNRFIADLLISFVAFAAQDDDIARCGPAHGQGNGAPAVRLYYIFILRPGNTRQNIPDDGHRLLGAGVVA